MNYTSARLGLVCALLFLCSAVVFGWDDQSSSSSSSSSSTSSSSQSTSSENSGSTAAPSSVDDMTLTTKVNQSIASDKAFSALGIQVETQNGIVTLTGALPSDIEVERALQMIRNIEGVESVDSKLTVNSIGSTSSIPGSNAPTVGTGNPTSSNVTPNSNLTPSDEPVGNNPTTAGDSITSSSATSPTQSPMTPPNIQVNDDELTKQVETKLDADQDIDGKVKVEVINGDVILRGHIRDRAEQERIVELVRSADGVKDVHSMLILESSK